jgi:hypothetical protein
MRNYAGHTAFKFVSCLHFSPRGRGSVVLVLAARVVGHLLDIDGALRAKVLDTPGVITSVHSRVDREPCPPGNATTGRKGGWVGGWRI